MSLYFKSNTFPSTSFVFQTFSRRQVAPASLRFARTVHTGGWLKRMPVSAQTSRATTASSCSIPVRPSDSVTAQRTNDSRAAAARWMVFGSESAFGAVDRFCCFKRPDSSWQPCGSELQSWTPVTEGGARLELSTCCSLAIRPVSSSIVQSLRPMSPRPRAATRGRTLLRRELQPHFHRECTN